MQPQSPDALNAPEQQSPAFPSPELPYTMHEQLPNASVLPGQQFWPLPWSPEFAMQVHVPAAAVAPEQQSPAFPSPGLPYTMHEQLPNESVLPGQQFAPLP
jgi:hypothetical protein